MALEAFWHGMGQQLRAPQGAWGVVAGRLMRLVNARANRLAIDALAPAEGEHVLELGCGPGHGLKLIARRARIGQLVGIDHSSLMLEQARLRNPAAVRARLLSLLEGQFAALPVGDASVDAVAAINVAYFMDADAAKEVFRVLKPGGRTVLYVTHRLSMRAWPFAGPESHHQFDEAELLALLRDGGFRERNVEISRVNAGFGVQGMIARAVKN